MSTKHIRTTADLVRFGAGLKIECASGASRTMDDFEVAKRCGTGALRDMAARLKCARCGAKEARLTILPRPAGR